MTTVDALHATEQAQRSTSETPTIWGLSPAQVHDRFWASRGIQVVRHGEPLELVDSAELYLLIDPNSLVLFRVRDLVEMLSWIRPRLTMIRLKDQGHDDYSEVVRTDDEGRFESTQRIYQGLDSRLARVGLTPHKNVAQVWRDATTSIDGWRLLRQAVPAAAREARSVPGRVFDANLDQELMSLLERLVEVWAQPDSTVPRVASGPQGAWVDRASEVAPHASIVGRVWIGAGRKIQAEDLVVGPAILWDDKATTPLSDSVPWQEIEPVAMSAARASAPKRALLSRAGKRLFDILFSLAVLTVTLPFYPFIALAIILEDGWPVFFAHRRETLGGREFPCLKFRSMRKDAEDIKAKLQSENVSDGPQFFVENDPRTTRVGAFLRKTQLDEIPQFLNVLVGHMSVVGPRPSPRSENQYCPSWREERLSVRPGVTGLWQVQRTRAEGLDFQEWIRYDLEYVERMSLRLDLWILWRTVGVVLGRGVVK